MIEKMGNIAYFSRYEPQSPTDSSGILLRQNLKLNILMNILKN